MKRYFSIDFKFENQKSELKHDSNRRCLVDNLKRLSFVPVLFFVLSSWIACSDDTGQASWQTSQDALQTCRTFLHTLQDEKQASIEKLAFRYGEWLALSDSVGHFLAKDTVKLHAYPISEHRILLDSIQLEFRRLALSQKRNYKDVYYLKQALSQRYKSIRVSPLTEQLTAFFQRIDSIPPKPYSSSRTMLLAYDAYLNKVQKQGIHSVKELQRFVQEEQIYFKSFLCFLPELSDRNVSTITHGTEQCCKEVMACAARKEITEQEARAYLIKRMNTRILMNARMAQLDIENSKVCTPEAAKAYLWMLLQPFFVLDDFSMAFFSEQEMILFSKLAADKEKLLAQLDSQLQLGSDRLSVLPQLLLKAELTPTHERL